MFLELYLHFGRQLLFSLAYLTAAPFVVLYFPVQGTGSSWLYFFYFVFFIHATLDYAKQEGYINTLHSSKFVPSDYGRVRSYFRYIRNRGAIRNLLFLVPIFVLFTYPYLVSIYEDWTIRLSQTAVFYSCIIPLFYTLFKVTKFVPEFFQITEMELSSEDETHKKELSEDEKEAIKSEKAALREYLLSRGIDELDPSSPVEFLDGDLWAQFLQDGKSKEAWFNININLNNSNNFEIRKAVLNYACSFFKYLYESKVDLNVFVTSFHIKIANQNSRNIFIRTNRGELNELFRSGTGEPESISNFKTVLFDELFRV